MARRAIVALDQGTTNTKAILVDEDGVILASASRPTGVSYPREGWAEQSAEDIWSSSVAVLGDVIAQANGQEIAALGITNQRESVILWDAETGLPLGPCVIWQCLRSAPLCAELRAAGHAATIHAISGLKLDPLFSAGKLRWLIDNAPDAPMALAKGTLRAGTVDSWLLWKLTGGAIHATDCSNASRTQLLSLEAVQWSDELCVLFGVPRAVLPEVRASDSGFGETVQGIAGVPAGLPIRAMLGDSHAALFGHGIDRPGSLKATLGTGSSLMSPTSSPRISHRGLSGTIAWSEKGDVTYALEGNIAVSGHAAAFATELLGLDGQEALTALARTVPDSGQVVFVPALAGLGAPHHDARARGLICGMSLSTKPAHVARAALEAIALQIDDVLVAMEADLGEPIAEILVDGNAARNDMLIQLLADLTARSLLRPAQSELSALGAARMAAHGSDFELRVVDDAVGTTSFKPSMPAAMRQAIRERWAAAIRRASSEI